MVSALRRRRVLGGLPEPEVVAVGVRADGDPAHAGDDGLGAWAVLHSRHGVEDGEDPLETMLREVTEEIGVTLDPECIVEVYAGQEYSARRTKYHLYVARVATRPKLTISWEHSSYDWVTHDEFVEQSRTAQDTYMHMVHNIMKTPTQVTV